MAIAVGERLPDARFMIMTEDGPAPRTTSEVFAGKKVALFAVPGAFTPTCNNNHLPGFLDNADAFKAKGVDEIICVAVNDTFVLSAWAKATGAEGKITFLSDGNGEFTKALGLEMDGSAANLGLRSRRYAMIVEDSVVKTFNIEETPKQAEKSGAAALLGSL